MKSNRGPLAAKAGMPNNGDGNAYPYDGRTRPEWFIVDGPYSRAAYPKGTRMKKTSKKKSKSSGKRKGC